MRLTKKEIQEICNNYKLGVANSFKLIKEGLQNHNYIVNTDKGKYITRIAGIELSDNQKEAIKLEFKVLVFLNKNKFPYKIPTPIKNRKGEEISIINQKYHWVYEFIEGEPPQNLEKITNNEIKELAKALATYHKFVKNLKTKNPKKEDFRGWIYNRFDGIEKRKPKCKIDKLAKDNFNYIMSIVDEVVKNQCKENVLVIHRDFNKGNSLFKDKKLIAIIDFDNVVNAPRINDLSEFIFNFCLTKKSFDKKAMAVFLQNYEKINKLTNREKEAIPFQLLKNCSAFFAYFYNGLKKQKSKKYEFMEDALGKSKQVIKAFDLEI